MSIYWAVVGPDNIVISVEVASDEWVTEWTASNPDNPNRYLPTDIERRDYAGIGYSWDQTMQRFIPPMPDTPGTWVYDEEAWAWVNLDPPPEPPAPEE